MTIDKQAIEHNIQEMFNQIEFVETTFNNDLDDTYSNYSTSSKYILTNGEVSDSVYQLLVDLISKSLFDRVSTSVLESQPVESTFNLAENAFNEGLQNIIDNLPFSKTALIVELENNFRHQSFFDNFNRVDEDANNSLIHKYLTKDGLDVYTNNLLRIDSNNIDIYNYDDKLSVNIGNIELEESLSGNEYVVTATIYYKTTNNGNFRKCEVVVTDDTLQAN